MLADTTKKPTKCRRWVRTRLYNKSPCGDCCEL